MKYLSHLLSAGCNALQEKIDPLKDELAASKETNTISKADIDSLQLELTVSQEELAVNRKQLDEMSEKYQKLSNASGIDKLRDLSKQLSPSQTDALHAYTAFRIDKFETIHEEQQIQCTKQFVQLILAQLKQSIDEIVQLRKNRLATMEGVKLSTIQIYKSASASKTLIDETIQHTKAKIKQIKAHIEGWNQFLLLYNY